MADVDRALRDERSIVRTWLMRGTLHLVASDDLAWMLSAVGPVFAAGNQSRHAQLGLDDDTKARGVAAIRKILSAGAPLTRYELVARLVRYGIKLDPRSQAPIHLIAVAALQGVLCLGPDRDNSENTYVLLEDWIGMRKPVSRASAVAELARRYFAAYGPASLDDFVAWSGLPVSQARAGLTAVQASLDEVPIAGKTSFLPKGRLRAWREPASAAPSVRLLPAFDTYLLGYRSRDIAVPPALQKRLQRGGGWIHPAILINGRAVGAWSLSTAGGRHRILIDIHEPAGKNAARGIDDEVADIGRFLGGPLIRS